MNSEFYYIILTLAIIVLMIVDIWIKMKQLRVWEKLVEKEKKEK